ncbi:MOSC domain-containing protein [Mycobacterium sp. AMU20-3851]|uniref:MOSC domain-containing protein n=1 Tax=Mycobacterium sp. AMU20-3851 TaxID=3122055 RepID=UPI003754C7C6
MPSVLTVNLAHPFTNPDTLKKPTGIDKRPTDGPVEVRPPGPMRGGLGSGLVGDLVSEQKYHGGDDQAVYAYGREDLDFWEGELGRPIGNGVFGENLTTAGIDVTGARIGERWRIGADGLELEVTRPRTPCRTFAAWLEINGWIKTFTAQAIPGAYFRIISPGTVRAGDTIEIVQRPDHEVTIGLVFRAMTTQPRLWPELLAADALPEPLKEKARRRAAR